MSIKDLKGILDSVQDEILAEIDPRILFLYGSFASQNLDQEIKTFSKLTGEEGLFDKKPDFIAVVPDIRQAVHTMGSTHHIRNITRVLHFTPETPYYFNLKTTQRYHTPLKHRNAHSYIPYKIGMIGEDIFRTLSEVPNIYLKSRLSKFINVLHVDTDLEDILTEQLDDIRGMFVDLTLSTLPKTFSEELFIKRYCQVTYLAEAYRVFDIIRSKHIKIYNSSVYDINAGTLRQTRDIMTEILMPKVHERVESTDGGLFQHNLCQKQRPHYLRTFYEFMHLNLQTLKISANKNRVTNSLGGSDNLRYIQRKFR